MNPEERLAKIANEILDEATLASDVYTARPLELLRHLFWLGPANQDHERSILLLQGWLDQLYSDAALRIANNRHRAQQRVLDLRNQILRQYRHPDEVDEVAFRPVVYRWIFAGEGDREPERSEELTDLFFSGVRRQLEAHGFAPLRNDWSDILARWGTDSNSTRDSDGSGR
eukprot:GHVU01057111.1.p2 GENE.GHVU01057111.1~~GHVU01057111.1.p2  ORF type:complete len:171 (-),score=20.50 GHVU01057111.1:893-1405(-)